MAAIATNWRPSTYEINLNTGKFEWKIPMGECPAPAAKGMTQTGSENYGGRIVTAGGLVFIGATCYDKKFHAFDRIQSPPGRRNSRIAVGVEELLVTVIQVLHEDGKPQGLLGGCPGPALICGSEGMGFEQERNDVGVHNR
ncbi:MAG: hypothetical protein ABSH47_12450 [Bryobacteraceae bacterium]